MRKRKILIGVLAIAMVFLLSQVALAQGKGRADWKKGQAGTRGFYDLDLTTEQLTAIRDLRQKFVQETTDLRVKKMQLRQELAVLVQAEKWDEAKIKAKVKALSDLNAEMILKGLKMAQDVRNLLTEEQKAIWDLSGGRMGMGLAGGFCNPGLGGPKPGSGHRGWTGNPDMTGPGACPLY